MDEESDLLEVAPAPSRAVARWRPALVLGVLVVGLVIGAVAVWSGSGTSRGTDPAGQIGPGHLSAVVSTPTMTGQRTGSATWDTSARELVYLSPPGYSSSCPPTATARSDDDGALAIEIVDGSRTGICTADAGVVAVTVRGLDEEPVSVTVTAAGETRRAPIHPVRADGPEQGSGRLPCATTTTTYLDIPGPGRPTPQEAVHPYLGAHEIHLVSTSGRRATVTAMNLAGEVRRSYDLTLREDGWWPDGYDECLS